MKRSLWLVVTLLLSMVIGVGSVTAASNFPEREITWIVPYGPGGGYDLYSRAIAAQLPKYLPKKVNVIIKNIAGGGGLVGVAQVYKARPDGYTMGISYLPSPFVTQMTRGADKVGFDFSKMTFVAGISVQDQGIYVGANTQYKTLQDLQKAEKVRFSSTAVGAKTWMDIILVGKLFGINVSVVPGYKSSAEQKLAIQRGDADGSIHDTPLVDAEVKEGTLRPILFLGSKRDPLWPNIPCAKEVGVPEITSLQRMTRIVIAPPGLPQDVESVLSEAVWKALQDPEFLAWAEKAQYPVSPMNAKEIKQEVNETVKNFEKYMDYIKKMMAQ